MQIVKLSIAWCTSAQFHLGLYINMMEDSSPMLCRKLASFAGPSLAGISSLFPPI